MWKAGSLSTRELGGVAAAPLGWILLCHAPRAAWPKESLPFAKAAFTGVAMSMLLMFLEDPVRVLHECRRVRRKEARLAVYTSGPEMR